MTIKVGDLIIHKYYKNPLGSTFYLGEVKAVFQQMVRVTWWNQEEDRVLKDKSCPLEDAVPFFDTPPEKFCQHFPEYGLPIKERIIRKIKSMEEKWQAQQEMKRSLSNTPTAPSVAPETTSVSGLTDTNGALGAGTTGLRGRHLNTYVILDEMIEQYRNYSVQPAPRFTSHRVVDWQTLYRQQAEAWRMSLQNQWIAYPPDLDTVQASPGSSNTE